MPRRGCRPRYPLAARQAMPADTELDPTGRAVLRRVAPSRPRVCQLKAPACAEAAVEGDVEGVHSGLPTVGPALAALAGRVEAHDRQIEAFEGGLFGREVAAGVHGSAEPGINRFDRVCRADDGSYFPVKGQERHELGPGVLPEPDDRRVAFLPRAGELGEPVERLGLGRRGVDGRGSSGGERPSPLACRSRSA
jgi:hypothetical protein